jgi:hypothetical protein
MKVADINDNNIIQDNNNTNENDTYTFPVLARLLWNLGLEEYFAEVLYI